MKSPFIAARWAFGLLIGITAPQLFGQVVQLPTFQSFSIGTTVLIPDRGSMMIGGVDRAALGSTAFGVPGLSGVPGAGRLFGNRAIGGEIQASRLNAAATIIDLQELDRSVRSQAAGVAASSTNPAVSRKAAFLAQHIARNDKSTVAASAKANTNQPAVTTRPDAETEARDAYQVAEQAEARGQLATARINYKRAATLSRGKLRAEALARLAAISTPPKDPKSPIR